MFSTVKEPINKVKREPTESKKIFANYISDEFNTSSYKQINNHIKNWIGNLNLTFSQQKTDRSL